MNSYHKSTVKKAALRYSREDINKCSTEFKAQALQLSDEIGTRKASQDLGISYYTLSGRRKSQNRYKDNEKGKSAS